MAVESGGRTVGGPSGVSDAGVGVEDLGQIRLLGLDQFLQFGDLADFLEGKHLVLLVTVYGETSGVVAAVFESGEAWKTKKESVSQSEGTMAIETGCSGLPLTRVLRM
jgi:hypothetical protein